MSRLLLALALLLPLGCATQPASAAPPSKAPAGFWDHWGDGKAELAGYRLTQPRYGQPRTGTSVHITVTEDFTRASRVKTDGGHPDEYPVLKLNEVRDFQTGIYDYNVMTSTFVPLDGSATLGTPTKVSFSAQEWCGHAYEQLLVDPKSMRRTLHSYFDGEADKDDTHSVPAGAFFGDAAPLLVRGLLGDLVAPGQSTEVPYLPTSLHRRLLHTELSWSTATLSRSADTKTVAVPAGEFEVFTVSVAPKGLPTVTYEIEAAYPHRLVRWSGTDGEEGVLTGVFRGPYWSQNRNGDEKLLEKLNLGD